MNKMKQLFLVLVAALLVAVSTSWAQATLTSTTLSAAVTSASATTIRVASATGFTANTTMAYLDKEAVPVTAVNGLLISVVRGAYGTRATTHTSGQTVYVGPMNYFTTYDRNGSCTSTSELVLPLINVSNGNIFRCTNSVWANDVTFTNVTGTFGNNLDLQTVSDSKPVRINSRNYSQTSGSSIGFQVKPAQTVANTDMIMGGEISPRINSGIGGKGIIGLHADTWLRGTVAGTLTGDVRTLNIEAYTDDAGTRTINGNVSIIRIRSAFSATTISGKFVPIRVEKAETQTNSKNFDALFELTGISPLVWNDDPGSEVNTATAKGYIGVLVNGAKRYIPLLEGAPTD